MKPKKIIVAMALSVATLSSTAAQAEEMNSITQLACEALLCLSTPTQPAECAASMAHYFGIVFSRPWRTIQARKNFLKLCPDVTEADVDRTSASAAAQDGETARAIAPADGEDTPPAASAPADAPSQKAQLQAALAALRPVWNTQAELSTAARVTLEKCVQQHGRIEDGFCASEKADYDGKRIPAISLREEVTRLETLLADMDG